MTSVVHDATSSVDRDLARRVAAWSAEEGWEAGDLQVLAGGNSGLTFQQRQCREGVERRIVVKAAPPGRPAIGRHDVARQARLLEAVAKAGGAVPAVLGIDDEPPAWFAMTFVPGEAVEPVLDPVVFDHGTIRPRFLAAAEALAGLHALDVDEVVPGDETPWTPAAELDRWVQVMDAVPAEMRPRASSLLEALRGSVPAPMAPTLLHGDFRLGNVLCHGVEVQGVIDWEIWSVGDPRVDLAYFLLFTDARDFAEAAMPVELPGRDEVLAAYEAAAGTSLQDVDWFDGLARFKLAAVVGHNIRRHREGRHVNPEMERMPGSVTALVDGGLRRLEVS